MERISRREFLAQGGQAATAVAVGVAGGATASAAQGPVPQQVEAAQARAASQFAVLFDSTKCVGCRSCELACAAKNGLGRSPREILEGGACEDVRALGPNVLTYVTRHPIGDDPSRPVCGKVQCMHCIEPACVASCPVAALEKTLEGPVVWHADLCLGCRYCVLACPFSVPRFEWSSPNPRIRKCDMCYDRVLEGHAPACVAACPTGALAFGRRADLLEIAHRRIAGNPRDYWHHVYGEFEAGGTNVLHLAAYPFGALGYRQELPLHPYPDYTHPAMRTIPWVVSGLVVALGAMSWMSNRRREVEEDEEGGRR